MPSSPVLQAGYLLPYQQRLISSQTALPLVINAGASASLTTVPITVPNGEVWAVVACGFVVSFSAGGIVAQGVGGVSSNGLTPTIGGAAGSSFFIPTQIATTNANNAVASVSLQGVELNEGDSLTFGMLLTNPTAGAINATAVTGLLRYKPYQLVSERSIVGVQDSRQDFALDQRLRFTRG